MADKKDEEKKEDDERIEFLYKYLVLSRKIKLDKWIKMLTNEEYKVQYLNLNFNLNVKFIREEHSKNSLKCKIIWFFFSLLSVFIIYK